MTIADSLQTLAADAAMPAPSQREPFVSFEDLPELHDAPPVWTCFVCSHEWQTDTTPDYCPACKGGDELNSWDAEVCLPPAKAAPTVNEQTVMTTCPACGAAPQPGDCLCYTCRLESRVADLEQKLETVLARLAEVGA